MIGIARMVDQLYFISYFLIDGGHRDPCSHVIHQHPLRWIEKNGSGRVLMWWKELTENDARVYFEIESAERA